MNIQPLGDRVIIEVTKKTGRKEGGIHIPDDVEDQSRQGKVVAVGTGGLRADGTLIPFNVKMGDLVLMPKYGGTRLIINGVELEVLRELDLLGVIT